MCLEIRGMYMDLIKNGLRNVLEKLDYILMSCLILLVIISLLAIYSASGQYHHDPSFFMYRQLFWFGLGFIIMIAMLFLDYEHYRNLAIPLYVFGLFLLIFVHFFGETSKGAQRWISIGSFEIQPSEFMKLFLIIMLATAIYKINEKSEKVSRNVYRKDFKILMAVILFGIVPFYFIFKQPDLGTALITAAIMGTILFVSGISIKYIIVIVTLIVSFMATLGWLFVKRPDIFSTFFEAHQLDRIYGWLQPEQYSDSFGYQLSGAKIGIGSGRLFGSGFQNGEMSQSGRVPEVHTDFIFTVIGEEFGFLGTALLIIIYFVMIYRMIIIAINSKDSFGMMLVAGVVGLLSFQIFQNIGMTIGIVPITGVTLPFISYGGSSILTNMLAVGIVLNVHVHTREYMFGD